MGLPDLSFQSILPELSANRAHILYTSKVLRLEERDIKLALAPIEFLTLQVITRRVFFLISASLARNLAKF